MSDVSAPRRVTGMGWASAAPLGLLALTHFLMQADRNLPALILPLLKRSFVLSDTALGLLQGPAFALFFVVSTLAVGQAVDRAPQLKLLAGSVLLWTLASIGFGLSRSWEELLLCRLLLGLCQALVQPAALSLIVARTPAQDVGRSISVFTTGSALGRSGAMLLGGLLLAWSASPLVRAIFPGLEAWRVLFFLSALPNLLVALGLLLADRRGAVRAAPPVQVRRASVLVAFEQMRAGPLTFGGHLLGAGCVIVLVQAASAWMPTLLQRDLGLSAARSGIVSGLIVMAGAPLGHLSGGALTDFSRRLSRPPSHVAIGALALCVAGAGLLCLPSPSLITVGAGFFMLTVFGGVAAVVFLAMYQPMLSSAHGASNAVYFAVTTLIGVGLGPPVIGLLSDRVFGAGQLGKALFCTALAAGLAAALLAWCGRRGWARVVEASRTVAPSEASGEGARRHG